MTPGTPYRCVRAMLVAAMLMFTLAPRDAGAQDPYFKGRTVTILVGYSAGGPQDLTARVFAQYLSKHLTGNPSVIVSNAPGASSVRAHNLVYEGAKANGETLLWVPWHPIGQLLNTPGVRYKYQNFSTIGMFHIPGYFVYARTDAMPGGLKGSTDILRAPTVRFAGGSPEAGYDLHATLSFKLLGVPYTHITGYRGSADMRAAVMKGEGNAAADVGTTIPAVLEELLFKPGIAKVLYGFPMLADDGTWIKDPTLASYPTVMEVYREAFGKDPAGPSWDLLELVMRLYSVSQMLAAPPATPPAIVEELRRAYVAAMTDPAFKAEYEKRFSFVPEPAPQKTVEKVIGSLDSINPDLVAALKQHVESKPAAKP